MFSVRVIFEVIFFNNSLTIKEHLCRSTLCSTYSQAVRSSNILDGEGLRKNPLFGFFFVFGLCLGRCPLSSASDVDVVMAWHAALNAGEVERLVSLSAPDVEVGGPRGSGRGIDLLRDWVARAGVVLEPSHVSGSDGTFVVEQRARWRGEEASSASR